MATDKKSFVLYADLIKSIEHLTNEEKGILFNHLLEYVNDMNPILTDRLLITAWKPIELQLKRDLIKFEVVKSVRSNAGKLSAEKRKQQISTNPTNVDFVEQTSTNPTVNVNVNDNVNVINKRINSFDDSEKENMRRNIFDDIDHMNENEVFKDLLKDWTNYLLEKGKKLTVIQIQTFANNNKQIYGKNSMLFRQDVYFTIENGYLGLVRKHLKEAGFDEYTGKKIPQFDGDYAPIDIFGGAK